MNKQTKELNDFLTAQLSELISFADKIDEKALLEARDLILEAEKNKNRVHVTGIGKPGHVAGYAASLFSSTGTPAYELHGTEAVHGSSGQVLPGDVVIAISNSGETSELKATVETLKKNKAFIISVTGKLDSWLARKANVVLFAGVDREGDSINKPPRASISAEILIIQSLSILLQEAKHLDQETYVKWHPGGSIGESLRKEK